jgi:hypothetical protein
MQASLHQLSPSSPATSVDLMLMLGTREKLRSSDDFLRPSGGPKPDCMNQVSSATAPAGLTI